MLNKYQRSALEYQRITRIIGSGMNRAEIARLFVGLDAGHYLRAIGGDPSRRTERSIASLIFDKFMAREVPPSPIMPETIPAPPVITPDILDDNVCDGCTELDKIDPKNRRWHKADRGEAITASLDMNRAPKFDGISEARLRSLIIATCEEWAEVEKTSINIEWLSTGKGDIHLEHDDIDGPGRILGATWVSRDDTDMGAAGDLVGDIIIDIERWVVQGLQRYLQTIRHEFGHALGAGHFEDWRDLMNPSPTPYNLVGLGKQSTAWAQETYPLQVAA